MRPSTTSRAKPLPEVASWRFDAIGTAWQVDTAEPVPDSVRRHLLETVETFDRTYSRFRDDSLVSRIASAPGAYRLPADAAPLLAFYRTLYEATHGAVTPLVGGALETLGYDRRYSLSPSGTPERVPTWDEAIAWDGETLTALRPVILDVGAAGKGYLVDIVLAELEAAGVADALVDASGDMRLAGGGSIRVALEHPGDPSRAVGIAELSDAAICGSAINRRRWGNGLHHVIDAASGMPTRRVVATWAVAPTALEADGLATALFFADRDALAPVADFEFVRIFADGRIERSAGFQGEVFS
jgi:thiamine biosynthesis lipoprotein